MFGSKKANPSEPTVIGKGAVIEGTVRVLGPVQVDGEIDGSLLAEGHVSVGPTGIIMGDVVAEDLALGGRIEGRIEVRKHLYIAPGASARGEVRYGTLQVDRGGVLDGSTLTQNEAGDTPDPVLEVEAQPALQAPPVPPPAGRRATAAG